MNPPVTDPHPRHPADPHASPSEMPLAADQREMCWYKPGFAETARLLGWRWIYFLPAIAMVGLLLYVRWNAAILQMVVAWWKLLVIAVAIPTGVAINAAQHAIRCRRDPFCIHCGYTLNGLPDGHNCPECGRPFNLRVIEEYRRNPNWFIHRYQSQKNLPQADVPFDAGKIRSKRKSRDGT